MPDIKKEKKREEKAKNKDKSKKQVEKKIKELEESKVENDRLEKMNA